MDSRDRVGHRWAPHKIEEVLDGLAFSGNIRATARETGVSKSTVHKWSNHYHEEIEKRREEMLGPVRAERVEREIEWNAKIGKEMRESLEGLLSEVQARMGGRKVTLRDLAYAFGLVFDRRLLHEGEVPEGRGVLERILEKVEEER